MQSSEGRQANVSEQSTVEPTSEWKLLTIVSIDEKSTNSLGRIEMRDNFLFVPVWTAVLGHGCKHYARRCMSVRL